MCTTCFNIKDLHLLSERICVCRMIMKTKRDYFPKQYYPVELWNKYVFCFLWGTNLIFKFNLDEHHVSKAQSIVVTAGIIGFISNFIFFHTLYIYVFHMILRINRLFPSLLICFLWGTNLISGIRKPKSRGPCLKPLLLTVLTYSLSY
jgi:hypothetical protein